MFRRRLDFGYLPNRPYLRILQVSLRTWRFSLPFLSKVVFWEKTKLNFWWCTLILFFIKEMNDEDKNNSFALLKSWSALLKSSDANWINLWCIDQSRFYIVLAYIWMQNVCVIKMIRKWEAALYEWYSNVIINSWTFEIIHKVLNLLFEKVELMKCWWFREDKSDCFLVWNHFWHTWVDTSRPHCRVFSHLATRTRHVNSEQATLSEAETYSPQSINHQYYTH